MNEKFINLPIQTQIAFSTIPIYVSSTQNPDAETDQQVVARQEIFLKLPKGIRWKLASFDIGDKIESIGRKYGFELLHLANITRLIREYYFGEVRFEDFPREIEKRMGVSLLTAQEIARFIRFEIIDWDPWVEYLAKLPHLPLREILAKYPKIANIEITAGYIELKGSEDLENPTIKNWLHDYVLHLGQERHSQMERTRYLFHSENGKNLSSPDREKLGIILKSFDEKTPMAVDEENMEIVFDIDERQTQSKSPSTSPFSKGGETTGSSSSTKTNQNFPLSQRGIEGDFEKEYIQQTSPTAQNDFIRPYNPTPQPQRQIPKPAPAHIQTAPPQNFVRPNPLPEPQLQRQAPPISQLPPENFHPNLVSLPPAGQTNQLSHVPPQVGSNAGKTEIDKFFNVPEAPGIPPMKIHSIADRNEPKIAPQVPPRTNIQHPLPPRQTSAPQTSPQPSPYKGEGVVRSQHKIIDPFTHTMPEPRIDGNVVDLREE